MKSNGDKGQSALFGNKSNKEKDTDESSVFDMEEQTPWEKEWQGMPEFVQEKQDAYAKVIFRFDNEEDLQDFAKLVGQKLTKKTKSAWYPFKSHWGSNIGVY